MVQIRFSKDQKYLSVALPVFLAFFGAIPGAAEDILTVPKTLERRCVEFKDSTSCYELGLLYYGSSTAARKSDGKGYLMRGCALEMARDCSMTEAIQKARVSIETQKRMDSAIHEEKVRVTEGEMTKDEIACWNGSAEACDRAGTHHYFISVPINPKKGVELFEEGCRLGLKNSCSTLGLIKKGGVKVFSVEMDN